MSSTDRQIHISSYKQLIEVIIARAKSHMGENQEVGMGAKSIEKKLAKNK